MTDGRYHDQHCYHPSRTTGMKQKEEIMSDKTQRNHSVHLIGMTACGILQEKKRKKEGKREKESPGVIKDRLNHHEKQTLLLYCSTTFIKEQQLRKLFRGSEVAHNEATKHLRLDEAREIGLNTEKREDR